MTDHYTHVVLELSAPDARGEAHGMLQAIGAVAHVARLTDTCLLAVLEGSVREDELDPVLQLMRCMPSVASAVPGTRSAALPDAALAAIDMVRELLSGTEPLPVTGEPVAELAHRWGIWLAISDMADRAEAEAHASRG